MGSFMVLLDVDTDQPEFFLRQQTYLLAATLWTGQIKAVPNVECVPASDALGRRGSAHDFNTRASCNRRGSEPFEIETERVFALVGQRTDLDIERRDPLGVMLGRLVERNPEHSLNNTHFMHAILFLDKLLSNW